MLIIPCQWCINNRQWKSANSKIKTSKNNVTVSDGGWYMVVCENWLIKNWLGSCQCHIWAARCKDFCDAKDLKLSVVINLLSTRCHSYNFAKSHIHMTSRMASFTKFNWLNFYYINIMLQLAWVLMNVNFSLWLQQFCIFTPRWESIRNSTLTTMIILDIELLK